LSPLAGTLEALPEGRLEGGGCRVNDVKAVGDACMGQAKSKLLKRNLTPSRFSVPVTVTDNCPALLRKALSSVLRSKFFSG